MNRLAAAYLDAGRFTEAEKIARECLNRRDAKSHDDWLRFRTMSQLGGALAGEKKYDEAEKLLIDGYEGMKARERKISAPLKKELASALSRIVQLYLAWGKPEMAAEWRASPDSSGAHPAQNRDHSKLSSVADRVECHPAGGQVDTRRSTMGKRGTQRFCHLQN